MANSIFITPNGFSNNGTNIVFPTGYGVLMDSLTTTGQIQGPFGTAAAPGIAISPNDGWYGSAGVLRASCGGVANCMVITNGAASVNGSMSVATLASTGKATTYNNIVTAGIGLAGIYGYGDTVAATNVGTASIATYTPAADGTFEVSGNVLITTSTTHSFSLDCTYTDESNVARTLVIPVAQLAGTFVTSGLITNITGAGPYESATMTIRCKAATVITVRTSAGGTFTTVVYNARGVIKQLG